MAEAFEAPAGSASHEPGAPEPGSVTLPKPGRYILSAQFPPADLPFSTLRFGRSGDMRSMEVPALPAVQYYLKAESGGLSLAMPGATHFDVRPLRMSDWLVWRNLRRRDRYLLPIGHGLTLHPLLKGIGPEGRELMRTVRNLRGWGFGLQSSSLEYAVRRRFQAPARTDSHVVSTRGLRIAIVLHLYYVDLWPEFETALAAIEQPFDLIITIVAPDQAFADRVAAKFPRSTVVVYPNKGRDVGPFLQLLHEGRLEGFDIICKLHGKRSARRGLRAVLGTVWRWTLIRELLGSTGVVQEIIDRFADDPSIGMIGARRFRLPNKHLGNKGAWGENEANVYELAARLGLAREAVKLDFFAGTMFWIRSPVLDVLKTLDLSMDDFAAESGLVDGALEHALERLFGIAVAAAGMRIDDVSDDPDENQPEGR
ncbi:rhamnan synthesis F [Kaistia dalseonensis]|uniref:Lipopolysaccharide biosynthesis protein n=1 Tax=Kaistia dalseonensis TaxID=410840 RepID=A0ABU0H7H6_9HYPH|nr:rhamnan synthesis F family protein [Kaistia dalseonensis]MCX5495668.1 rhamnan synthesis F [Kaistia dalseonensis]MDQ0438262.1 lipopolysaccharide biosynthesis protein [Kaistia dalseonensis]